MYNRIRVKALLSLALMMGAVSTDGVANAQSLFETSGSSNQQRSSSPAGIADLPISDRPSSVAEGMFSESYIPAGDPRDLLTSVNTVFQGEGQPAPFISFHDEHGFVKSPQEPPVPLGWYPTGAGMGGFPPVPKFIDHGKSLHDVVEQNITVRLRGGGILRPYGLVRGDIDVASAVFNDIQNPQYVLSSSGTQHLGSAANPVDPTKTNYSLYPRLTRLGLEYYGQPIKSLDGAVGSVRTEVDFLTSTPVNPESRELLRLRLAYAQLVYHDWTFLVGQDWDVASPLNPSINDNTLQWNAGNTGDRRPQAKILWDHDFGEGYRLQFQNAMALMDAISANPDLDGDGFRDNEFTGIPGYEGRVGFVAPSWVEGKKMLGGFWGIWSEYRFSGTVAGRSGYQMWGYGTDLHLPLTDWFTFRSEFFHGENLGEFRGGIGQSLNPVTGQNIVTTGGWFEIVTQPVSWYQHSVGYSIDDPQNSTVHAGGRTLNHSFYVGNRFIAGRGFVCGMDVQKWLTEYQGLSSGNAVLFKAFAQMSF